MKWPRLLLLLASGALVARALAVPGEPYVAWIYPAGGQRGSTVQVALGGERLEGASAVRLNQTGLTARLVIRPTPSPTPGAKPKPSVTLFVTIPPDAPLGLQDLRVVTPGGVSNRVRFEVGRLPEVLHHVKPATRDQAQTLPELPVLVNGQVLEGDRHFYRFAAGAGQTVVCAARARALQPYIADAVPGWNQLSLTAYDAISGESLESAAGSAGATVRRFQTAELDPVLAITPRRFGSYVLELRDVIYRGRQDFVYRLDVGQLPYLTRVFPLGGARGQTARVNLYGFNLPTDPLGLEVPLSGEPLQEIRWGSSNALPFAASDLPSTGEAEPNNTPATAQAVAPPVVLDGRVERPGDVDCFAFQGRKGQAMLFEVQARRLGSPLDSVLTLFGPAGQKIADNDDAPDPEAGLLTHQADSRILHTLPADGRYVIRLHDAQRQGGADYAYRLTVAPPQPDFALRLTPDNPRVFRGDCVALMVRAIRKGGYNEPIAIAVTGLPAGFSASPATLDRGLERTWVTLSAPPGAALEAVTPVVQGTGQLAGKPLTRPAVPSEEKMQAFSFRSLLPSQQLTLTVMDSEGSALALLEPPAAVKPGGEAQLLVRAVRPDGVKSTVQFSASCGSAEVTGRGTLPPDQPQGVVTLTVGAKVRPDTIHNVVVRGTFVGGKETVTRTLPLIPLQVRKTLP